MRDLQGASEFAVRVVENRNSIRGKSRPPFCDFLLRIGFEKDRFEVVAIDKQVEIPFIVRIVFTVRILIAREEKIEDNPRSTMVRQSEFDFAPSTLFGDKVGDKPAKSLTRVEKKSG
jgi:hypothetical protein